MENPAWAWHLAQHKQQLSQLLTLKSEYELIKFCSKKHVHILSAYFKRSFEGRCIDPVGSMNQSLTVCFCLQVSLFSNPSYFLLLSHWKAHGGCCRWQRRWDFDSLLLLLTHKHKMYHLTCGCVLTQKVCPCFDEDYGNLSSAHEGFSEIIPHLAICS